MRKLFFSFLLITTMVLSQIAVYANSSADTYSKVYVPLPYILSTSPGLTGTHVDLSAIVVNRGVYSYALYRLMYPSEQPPPAISAELKIKYGYSKYSDKRFEPLMKDYTIWAMEAGYLSPVGKTNHLLSVKWADIQSLFTALNIQPEEIKDYSIYDADNWGFVTDSEKNTIGLFRAAFGRGIDTNSIERKKFTLTIADIIYLAGTMIKPSDIEVNDEDMLALTGYFFSSDTECTLDNSTILSVCFPYAQTDNNGTELSDLKKWAKKEGFVNYEN